MQLGTFFTKQKDGIIIYESQHEATQHESQRQLHASNDNFDVQIKFGNEKVHSSIGIEISQNGKTNQQQLEELIFTTDSKNVEDFFLH